MKALQAVSLILGIIVSALTIAEKNGIWLPSFVAFVNGQSAWLLPLICIVFGFAVGWNARKRTDAKAPRGETKEEINARNAEATAKNRRVIMELSADLKTMFKTAVVKSCVYCKTDDWWSFAFNNSDFYAQLVESENIDGERTRIRPTELLRSLVEANADLFDFVSDEAMAEYAVYDPSEKARSSVLHSGGRLVWWWYSHDPEIDHEKAIAEDIRAKIAATEKDADNRKLLLIRGFSRAKARAIIEAYESDKYIEVGEYDTEIVASIQNNEGIFLREAWKAYGMSIAGSKYSIKDDWRAFLRSNANMAALKEVAGIE